MTNDYRDSYYGSILDPLHGDIKLSELEKWCLSYPLFSRLRRIKQNTFLYYVFPSANHTRFEHSMGVMHLAGKIFDSCKENYATGQKKKEKYSINGESNFFDINKLGEKEEIFYQELRLAALLHDLGHGPFSHLFDEFAISKQNFLRIIEQEITLNKYKEGFEKLITNNEDKVNHEIISCAFIFILFAKMKKESSENPKKFSLSATKLLQNISPERIVRLVEPDFFNLPNFLDEEGNDYTLFFSRIISAFPIDADRMDYLLRDSYFSGVTYGVYDLNRIFSSFLATFENKNISLTFKESGLDSVLRFIQSRSHLYNQVYFHKTNRSANAMLTYGTNANRINKIKLLDKLSSFSQFIVFYIENSDEFFLRNTVSEKIATLGFEKDVIGELISRKLFKRVYQSKIVLQRSEYSKIEDIKKIKKEIDLKLENLKLTNEIYTITDRFENDTYKDSDKKCILVAIKSGKEYTFKKDWRSIGREFELADMNVSIIRIYLRRTFSTPSEFENMKRIILETVKTEIDQLKKFHD